MNLTRFVPFAAGLLFSLGLIVSGMSDPQRVLGFLDFAGAWNPALALVMAGAVAVALPAFAWVRRHRTTLAGAPVVLPARSPVTARLVIGSVLFGVGWGLSGVCPGPSLIIAVTGLAAGAWQPPLFLASAIAGMLLHAWWSRRVPASPAAVAAVGGQ